MTKTAKNRKEELLDELLKDCKNPEDITGENGLLKQLVKGLMERALDGELTHHLGYEKHAALHIHSENDRELSGYPDTVAIAIPLCFSAIIHLIYQHTPHPDWEFTS